MPHTITVSDETYARLQALARPFVDLEPEHVLRRLLDAQEKEAAETDPCVGEGLPHQLTASPGYRRPSARLPRQRGATIRIGDATIEAVSVRDLYEQALSLLVPSHQAALESLVPMRTSGQRYLIAKESIHPSGRPFVMPVEYGGYAMEAHKDYKNAVAHLEKLAARIGLPFKYID